ncbi:uncharacterized protein [Epargyreus clarus]|uniref:uncharacterized protein n=1 Tax=Epargyreus clarus TaxID=520877 RepID=UPI003C2CE232
MFRTSIIIIFVVVVGKSNQKNSKDQESSMIDIIDLTYPTTWEGLSDFYGAMEKRWKICVNCGIPGLGTAIHMGHTSYEGSVKPAVIPTEYLLTRLEIIDVSYLAKLDPDLSLSLDVARQWSILKRDPKESTLLLFKFGWKQTSTKRQCVCRIPGISYELADWIASNLSHVVGIGTDAPTLETHETRELSARTVSNVLGKSGIYIIANVHLRKRLPAHSCMSIAMPLKLLEAHYVPTRLTAFCPSRKTDRKATIALMNKPLPLHIQKSRMFEVNLNEILN